MSVTQWSGRNSRSAKMGGSASKYEESRVREKELRNWKEKVRLLQEEVKELMREKEKESKGYESDIMMYAFKEAEWKQERKKLKEEVKLWKMMVEDKEEKRRETVEAGSMVVEKCTKEWESLGIKLLMEQMKEERVQRDAAVDKWKHLYLEIKTELVELIQKTYYHGEEVCGRAEDDTEIEKLKEEVDDKKETIKTMEAKLASMEHEKQRKVREIDILRQSFRIMSTKKKSFNFKSKFFQSLHS